MWCKKTDTEPKELLGVELILIDENIISHMLCPDVVEKLAHVYPIKVRDDKKRRTIVLENIDPANDNNDDNSFHPQILASANIKSLEEIEKITKPRSYVVKAYFEELDTSYSWFYNSCKDCRSKVKQNADERRRRREVEEGRRADTVKRRRRSRGGEEPRRPTTPTPTPHQPYTEPTPFSLLGTSFFQIWLSCSGGVLAAGGGCGGVDVRGGGGCGCGCSRSVLFFALVMVWLPERERCWCGVVAGGGRGEGRQTAVADWKPAVADGKRNMRHRHDHDQTPPKLDPELRQRCSSILINLDINNNPRVIFIALRRRRRCFPFIALHIPLYFPKHDDITGTPVVTRAAVMLTKFNGEALVELKNVRRTRAKITPYYPSEQKKSNKRSKIQEDFQTAKSSDEMLEAFKKMEAKFDERDLGLPSMKLGFQLEREGKDPEKILSFANRALEIFDNAENKCCLYIAMTLKLLGSTNYRLRKFDNALGFFKRAEKILVKLDNEGSYGGNDVKVILHAVLMELADVYAFKGMIEDIIGSLRKALELKENYEDGLPYGLKALGIHLRSLGENSIEVAHDRRVLGVLYCGMEEYERALEENRLAHKAFKSCGCSSELLRVMIDAANVYIELGRYEDAMSMLKEDEKAFEDNSDVLITRGKVLVHQAKFADAERCLERACSVLDKMEKSMPVEVSQAYMEIASEYQNMNEFEKAISFLKNALALLENLPDEEHLEGRVLGRIGLLLLMTGKATEAITYLERAADTVKESYGAKHFLVGYVYNNLGVAYLELERLKPATQMLTAAMEIMDASSLGPHHYDSIHACQNLSKAYAAMKSYPLAIELQQKAVNAWESHGRTEEDELKEAR
ncbi:hypothetical protein KSS87_014448 [Heliosperma pusillum]|nr:hypothetical protein KSS87_014448 [Heliosperma pusillum]